MDKNFFQNIRSEANIALTKIFDKVEQVTKVSGTKLKINSLKNEIKSVEGKIGKLVFDNSEKFSEFEDVQLLIAKINSIEEEIALKEEELNTLKENDKNEENKNEDSVNVNQEDIVVEEKDNSDN